MTKKKQSGTTPRPSKRILDAREAALLALLQTEQGEGFSNAVLKEVLRRENLERRDRALATRICYGVLQNRIKLDYYISHFSKLRLKKISPAILNILRVSAYQLFFMSRIPPAAAVSQGVVLAKKYGHEASVRFVNGVLRSLSACKSDPPKLPEGDNIRRLSIEFSHPEWLVSRLLEDCGESGALEILAAGNTEAPTCVQVNLTKYTLPDVLSAIEGQEIEAKAHPFARDCLMLSGFGDIEHIKIYHKGMVYVQDPAARLCSIASGVKPGMTVLDACAAPGGKSIAAAILMENKGKIISCDIFRHKVDIIEKNAARLDIDIIEHKLCDANVYNPHFDGYFDVVIADLPCSGIGVIRKKPDIRYKTQGEILGLPELQLEMLKNLSKYVKPGGVLLYSTCTLLKAENEEVVSAFLKGNPDFSPEEFEAYPGMPGSSGGMMTLLPGRYETDGFFICRMRKKHG